MMQNIKELKHERGFLLVFVVFVVAVLYNGIRGANIWFDKLEHRLTAYSSHVSMPGRKLALVPAL